MSLKDGEYYWLNAPTIDPENPLMIGEFVSGFMKSPNKWYIDGKFYTAVLIEDIKVIKRIPKPRVKKD